VEGESIQQRPIIIYFDQHDKAIYNVGNSRELCIIICRDVLMHMQLVQRDVKLLF